MPMMAQHCDDEQDESSRWASTVLTVVILNNCAEIHYHEQCDYLQAQMELEQINDSVDVRGARVV